MITPEIVSCVLDRRGLWFCVAIFLLEKGTGEVMAQLIKIYKGKETVVATGNRQKMNDRLRQIRSSIRGGKTGGSVKRRIDYVLRD